MNAWGGRSPHFYWWCDGFRPEVFDPADSAFYGKVWMGVKNSNAQFEWDFVAFVPDRTLDLERIDWDALLPPEDAHGWLTLNPQQAWLRVVLRHVW